MGRKQMERGDRRMEMERVVKKTRKLFRRYRKLFRLLAAVLILVCTIFYLITFFSSGIPFLDTFLKKSASSGTATYRGADAYGEIVLTVHQRSKTETDISYQVPYNKLKAYTVTLDPIANKDPDLPLWYKLTIRAGSGSILYDGKYQKGDPFLYTKADLPSVGDIEAYRDGANPYQNFEPNLRRMVGIATGEYVRQHGQWMQLWLGVGLLVLVWVDVKNPILSQKLRETVLGEGPVQSGLSKVVQFAIRVVIAIVGIGFLLAAI